jgi:hypothetical protein
VVIFELLIVEGAHGVHLQPLWRHVVPGQGVGQAAWAEAISSSGLVFPPGRSTRAAKVTGASSNAPLLSLGPRSLWAKASASSREGHLPEIPLQPGDVEECRFDPLPFVAGAQSSVGGLFELGYVLLKVRRRPMLRELPVLWVAGGGAPPGLQIGALQCPKGGYRGGVRSVLETAQEYAVSRAGRVARCLEIQTPPLRLLLEPAKLGLDRDQTAGQHRLVGTPGPGEQASLTGQNVAHGVQEGMMGRLTPGRCVVFQQVLGFHGIFFHEMLLEKMVVGQERVMGTLL